MKLKKIIKNNLSQIFAITEKNIKLRLRFKAQILISYLTPIISLIMPLIVMRKFFEFNSKFGPWNGTNVMVFYFLGYNIMLLQRLIGEFPNQFRDEKYWKTLPAIIIAPFNRFNLLLGIFFSHLALISIPCIFLFVLCYIFYPISIITFLCVIIIYFLVTLVISGIGLVMSVFLISKENYYYFSLFVLNFIFWLSCITYPFEIFPDSVQNLINLNPLYYIFDFLKLAWIENDIYMSITSHYTHFLILILLAISFPSIGVYLFNLIFKKYGIVGY